MKKYNQFPKTTIKNYKHPISKGWQSILDKVVIQNNKQPLIFETYPGVDEEFIIKHLQADGFNHIIRMKDLLLSKEELNVLLQSILTEDRVFGHVTSNNLEDFYDKDKINQSKQIIAESANDIAIVGFGSSLLSTSNNIVYFNLPRWEIQRRYRSGLSNYFSENSNEDILKKYKQGYFLEWRLADKLKVSLFDKISFMVDSTDFENPSMIYGDDYRNGLKEVVNNPFRLVPFFDPGVWGGQWMKETFNLKENDSNYAWSFDGVPEENSLLLQFNDEFIELPAIDVVLMYPKELLGLKVFHRFGAEFPIRFDLLDTMDGQNLSLQVHPTYEYIRKQFGMFITQEESYYLLDCKNDGLVYLGLKENVDKDEMIEDLRLANEGVQPFDDDKYVNKYVAKKHDHYLIPPGTIHCSGKDTMVLEISTSAYIFTFKLWDWGRVGLDGKPRPVHIDHATHVIEWDRDTKWTEDQLINKIELIEENVDVRIERTGLHSYQFIETYRYWINNEVIIQSQGTLNVLNLVEGSSATISSVDGSFDDYEVNYAETFILPANIREYRITPTNKGEKIAVIRAFVRGCEI